MTSENIPLSNDPQENAETLDLGIGELQSKVRDLSNKLSDENPDASTEEVSRLLQQSVDEINAEIPNTALAGTGVTVNKVALEEEGTVTTEMVFKQPDPVVVSAIKTLVPTKNILIVSMPNGSFVALDKDKGTIESEPEKSAEILKDKLTGHYGDKFALAFFDHEGEVPAVLVPPPPGIITTLGDLDWSGVTDEDLSQGNQHPESLVLGPKPALEMYKKLKDLLWVNGEMSLELAHTLASDFIHEVWGVNITDDPGFTE